VIGLDPLYILDEMTQLELSSIIKADGKRQRIGWEQTRVTAYASASAMGGLKNTKITEFMPFEWDKEKNPNASAPLTKSQIEKQSNRMNNILQKIQI
jgi:hypothetical protein